MFDNFGLGEFFFLAVLALLFFGPERLPQMGARLGRWVSRMTQYSKAFMTEWREEALAIHDAVAEVKGIRDEIVAAQAEISSTLQTARGDMNEGLEAAKEAVSGATRDVTDRMRLQQETAAQDLERAARERDGTAREAGDGEAEAIAKTQQILADLQQKRGAGTPDQAATAAPAESAEPEATEPAPADEEWESVRRLIEESLQPRPRADAQPAAVPEPAAMPEPAAAPEAAAMPEPAATPEPGVASEPVAASEPAATAQPEPPKESAFDRTQKILDGLMARRAGGERAEAKPAASGPSAAQAPAEGTPAEQTPAERTLAAQAPAEQTPAERTLAEPAPARETAFDRTQKILDSLAQRRQARAAPAAEAPAGAEPQALTVDRDEFEQLSADVLRLRDEIGALQREIAALSALARGAGAPVDGALDDDLPVEEVA